MGPASRGIRKANGQVGGVEDWRFEITDLRNDRTLGDAEGKFDFRNGQIKAGGRHVASLVLTGR